LQTKKKIGISIDCDLYEQAKVKYPKISTRINELLAMDLYGSDEKDKLIEELHNLKLREKAITKKLCELEKEEVQIKKSESNKNEVLKWTSWVYERKGYVPLNKLREECDRKGVDFDEIVGFLEADGVATINFG